MRIAKWDPRESAPLVRPFNDQEGEVPYARSVDSESFVRSILEDIEYLRDDTLFVALDGGQARGYVHAGIHVDSETASSRGIIRSILLSSERTENWTVLAGQRS